jgi:hypothetical protein
MTMGAVKEMLIDLADRGLLWITEDEAADWGNELFGIIPEEVPMHSRHTGKDFTVFGLPTEQVWEMIADRGGDIARDLIERLEIAGLPDSDPEEPLVWRCCSRLDAGLPLPGDYWNLETVADAGAPEAIWALDKLHKEIEAGVEPYTDLSPLRRSIGIEEALVRKGIL